MTDYEKIKHEIDRLHRFVASLAFVVISTICVVLTYLSDDILWSFIGIFMAVAAIVQIIVSTVENKRFNKKLEISKGEVK